jgi:hypothetical protein
VRLQKKARKTIDPTQASLDDSLRRWLVERYGLPPNHELFQKRTPASIFEEILTDLASRRSSVQKELREARGAHRRALQDQLIVIDEALGYRGQDEKWRPTGDDAADEMERRFARGEKLPQKVYTPVKRSKSAMPAGRK